MSMSTARGRCGSTHRLRRCPLISPRTRKTGELNQTQGGTVVAYCPRAERAGLDAARAADDRPLSARGCRRGAIPARSRSVYFQPYVWHPANRGRSRPHRHPIVPASRPTRGRSNTGRACPRWHGSGVGMVVDGDSQQTCASGMISDTPIDPQQTVCARG